MYDKHSVKNTEPTVRTPYDSNLNKPLTGIETKKHRNDSIRITQPGELRLKFKNIRLVEDQSFFEFKSQCMHKWGNIMFLIRRLERLVAQR